MNEGWASYWHSTIMTRQGATAADIVNYCDHHSGTMASSPTQLNPYKLGIELFRDIEDRWNRGKFGAAWEEMDDHEQKRRMNKRLGLGREARLNTPGVPSGRSVNDSVSRASVNICFSTISLVSPVERTNSSVGSSTGVRTSE